MRKDEDKHGTEPRPPGSGPSKSKHPLKTETGTALTEFTLVFPVFLFLMLNAINFGFYMYAWMTVSNAARAVAEYQSYNGAAVQFQGTPSYAQSSALFTADTSSLPGAAPSVTICRRNIDGTTTLWGGAGSCASIPSDPENTSFALWSVTASYNFTSIVPGSAIGIYTLPATIQQQVVMRSMQ